MTRTKMTLLGCACALLTSTAFAQGGGPGTGPTDPSRPGTTLQSSPSGSSSTHRGKSDRPTGRMSPNDPAGTGVGASPGGPSSSAANRQGAQGRMDDRKGGMDTRPSTGMSPTDPSTPNRSDAQSGGMGSQSGGMSNPSGSSGSAQRTPSTRTN